MNLFEKGMVKTMTASNLIPHFNLHEEYDVTRMMVIRKEYNDKEKLRVSVFAFFVKCFSLAILEAPKINSTYYPDQDPYKYYINTHHNISIAVNSKNGLAAPNIKNIE